MTTPIYPTWPTVSTPSVRRAPSVTAADDAQSAGAGIPSGDSGADGFESISSPDGESTHSLELADPGEHGPVGDYLIAAAESQHDNEVTVVDRDRAIAAFTDIMRMQI